MENGLRRGFTTTTKSLKGGLRKCGLERGFQKCGLQRGFTENGLRIGFMKNSS